MLVFAAIFPKFMEQYIYPRDNIANQEYCFHGPTLRVEELLHASPTMLHSAAKVDFSTCEGSFIHNFILQPCSYQRILLHALLRMLPFGTIVSFEFIKAQHMSRSMLLPSLVELCFSRIRLFHKKKINNGFF